MKFRYLACMSALALGAVIVAPTAKADSWDQRTEVTFGEPTQIPGQVLQPGTYVFRLADSPSNRDLVQVFSKSNDRMVGTFLAIPDYRLQPSSKPLITFEERPAGQPEAIRAWFYPGNNYGHQFVYPKHKAVVLAKANNVPVASMPSSLEEKTVPSSNGNKQDINELAAAPVNAQTPDEDEVVIAEVFQIVAPDAPQAPDRLPTTASPLPMIALMGLSLMGAGLSLRLVSAKRSN